MYRNIKVRIGALVVIAFFLAVVCFNYMKKFDDRVEIVVFAQDISEREIIQDKDLKIEKISLEDKNKYFPNALITKQEALGLVLRKEVKANKPVEIDNNTFVLEAVEEAKKEDGAINDAFFIPEGMRIIAVSLDSTGSINNTVSKGNTVDVIFTSQQASTGGIYSRIILQHIEVYDVQDIVRTENGVTTQTQNIMLLVTPEQSLDMALAGRNGVIDFVLNPLKGETDYSGAKSIFAYVENEPLSIRQQMEYVRSYVVESQIPEQSKGDILGSVDRALDKDTVELIIKDSDMSLDLKFELLDIMQTWRDE